MRAPRIVLFALLALLLAATAARAEEESLEVPPAAETPPPPAGAWAPPLPSAEEYDWLQVRSGEWLKGELKRLRDGRVIFDSDEFDKLDLNWRKVASFYLPRPHSFRVQGRVLFGTAELRGDVLRIRTPEAVVEFDRDELDSIAQGTGRELDWWGLKLGLAANFREGNTESVDIQGDGELRRETATTRRTAAAFAGERIVGCPWLHPSFPPVGILHGPGGLPR